MSQDYTGPKMAAPMDQQAPPDVGQKRSAPEDGQSSKKSKLDVLPQQPREDRKRKVALLLSYNGKGYHGIQVNPGFATIESELCKALLEVGLIPQQHHDCMQKMSFQRAARTDKGVSAAGNVVSLKMLLNVENLVEKVNEKLPQQIRVMDYVRTTNGFNCKNMCDARTYIYVIPTYAFSPMDQEVSLDYRSTQEVIQKVKDVLERFLGTHNFHNFTSGMKPTDGAAKRYIIKFECGRPFVRDGMEFCVLSVKGQSFMLHQIRKMIGLTIAIVRGFCDASAIDQAWRHEKMDVPKAPGLGLILEKLHYQRYNKLFAADGSHKEIEWSHIADTLEKFKEEQIFSEIIKEEIQEKSMMTWLQTLHNHDFQSRDVWLGKKKDQDNSKELDTSVTDAKDNRSKDSDNKDQMELTEVEEHSRDTDVTQNASGATKAGSENIDCVSDMTDNQSTTETSDCATTRSQDTAKSDSTGSDNIDCVSDTGIVKASCNQTTDLVPQNTDADSNQSW